jgi:uncharacterized membrane protein
MKDSDVVLFLMGAVYGLRDYAAKAPDDFSRKAVDLAADMIATAASVANVEEMGEENA